MEQPGTSWYAVWTRSRHEQVVRDQIARKHFDAFLPTITKWSRWKDRKKKVDWPLFPGYCFARFGPERSMQLYQRGIRRRLASMLGDRRHIELANSLMFSSST